MQHFELLGEGNDAADAASDNNPNLVGVITWVQMRLPTCGLGGYCRELGKTVHAPGNFPVQITLRIEPFDLASKTGVKAFRIEGGNDIDT